MSLRSVSFIIPVKDDVTRLRSCLDRIIAGTPADTSVEIVVADNGSTDDSADVARGAGAIVLALPGLRLGDLRNRAAAAARGDVLAFSAYTRLIDCDCRTYARHF